MIRGFVFDLDGTLLDTLTSIAGAFNRSLEKMSCQTHPVEAFRYFIGDGARVCAERCLGNDSSKKVDELLALWREDYSQNWDRDAAPYSGIVEMLHALLDRDCLIAALSNKDDEFTQQCITHFFPEIKFTTVLGFSEAIPHKPDPTGANRIAVNMNLPKSQIAMVGDTAVDIQTAVACNLFAVGVLWGFRDRQELVEAGAQQIISTPSELLNLAE